MPDALAVNVALHDPALTHGPDLKHELGSDAHAVEVPPYYEGTGTTQIENFDYNAPTAEELATLKRVPAKIKWSAYTIAFVELAERFSFYGTTITCMFYTAVYPRRSGPIRLFNTAFQLPISSRTRWWLTPGALTRT